MEHVVFFSGGSASWYVAETVKERHGADNLHLLFTDTLIEDWDLYRFMIETAADLYDVPKSDVEPLIQSAKDLTPVHVDIDERKSQLEVLADKVRATFPRFHWLSNGKSVWDIFYDGNFLGNSRIAPCSSVIKQKLADKYVSTVFDSDDTTLYLGIDWTEIHRTKAPTENWAPYKVEFPLCDEPYVNKVDIVKALDEKGIDLPRLYGMGFAHNNCGGFCVRGGQGHFANLLEKDRELFLWHEKQEQEFREYIGKDVSILRKQRNGERFNYTLRDLRADVEGGADDEVDYADIGGCGCFVTDISS